MALSAEEFQEKLAALKASYRQKLPGQLREFEALAAPVIAGDAAMQAMRDVHAMAHKLGGSSGTFGFSAFSDAAHEIEKFSGVFLNSAGDMSATERQEFVRLLEALKQAER